MLNGKKSIAEMIAQLSQTASDYNSLASELTDDLAWVERKLLELPGKTEASENAGVGQLFFRRENGAWGLRWQERGQQPRPITALSVEEKIFVASLIPKLIESMWHGQLGSITLIQGARAALAELTADRPSRRLSKDSVPFKLSEIYGGTKEGR